MAAMMSLERPARDAPLGSGPLQRAGSPRSTRRVLGIAELVHEGLAQVVEVAGSCLVLGRAGLSRLHPTIETMELGKPLQQALQRTIGAPGSACM
jgi:hypothetical protein